MKLRVYGYELPLRHEFTISRGSMTVQPTMIVELEKDGCKGYGESTTNDYYGHTLDSMTQSLSRVQSCVESGEWTTPESMWSALDPELCRDRFAQCALDQAAHDLHGKLVGKPVWQVWGLDIHGALPISNYTIGIDSIEKMKAKMDEFHDWPIFKIKLGTSNDLEIIKALRAHTSATFRVDANCGWTAGQTCELAPELKSLGVQYIEQPLPADDLHGMADISGQCALPIVADESCLEEGDVSDCFHAGFNGINIKLSKCGGLTPARRMIDMARKLGMKVMVGCMTESTVGISAIAQLLPLIDFVDMDGAVLLAKDIANGVRLDRGRCIYPATAGTGVELTETGEGLLD